MVDDFTNSLIYLYLKKQSFLQYYSKFFNYFRDIENILDDHQPKNLENEEHPEEATLLNIKIEGKRNGRNEIIYEISEKVPFRDFLIISDGCGLSFQLKLS